jgi:hypothetical protein
MIVDGWVLLLGIPATFGLPVLAVGVILRLCEGSWGKNPGELGSGRFLLWGCVLCLPLACYLVPELLARLKLLG